MSRVLQTLADLFEQSAAGRHGEGKIDVQPGYEELLARAGCREGDARELAERELLRAHEDGIVQLVPIHRRDTKHYSKVRLSPAKEDALYERLGRKSPSQKRAEWAALFREAAGWEVPERFSAAWRTFCDKREKGALSWKAMQPFEREQIDIGREWLEITAQLLGWKEETLIRWASSLICRDSKYLERRKKTLEALLLEASAGEVTTMADLGIKPVTSEVRFHGPVRFRIGGDWRDYRGYRGSARITAIDVNRIEAVECFAPRCLTVENLSPFNALVDCDAGELLIQTSYPNDATIEFLKRLHAATPAPEFWHFGDTDPAGFHILSDLRERTGIPFKAFRMKYRPDPKSPALTGPERELVKDLAGRMPEERKELEAMLKAGQRGDFEQESLRPPTQRSWPFYP